MNLAIAGLRHGHIFSIINWAENLDCVKIVAVWETDEEAIRNGASHGITVTYDDYDKMLLREDIDAVAVGDYFSARGEKIIKALNAGKHVISDKPICTDVSELNKIEKLSKEKNLAVGCMLDLRYLFCVKKSKEIISSGLLGKIHNISFGGEHPLNYGKRASWYFEEGKHGGTINDIAIHGLDLIRYITGSNLEKIFAAECWNGYAKEKPKFKDCAQFMIKYSGDIGVIADVSYASPSDCDVTPEQYWRFTFWGEKGILEFNYIENTVKLTAVGSKKTEIFRGNDSEENPLIDFVSEIEGNKKELTTQQVIASSREALIIQQFADKNFQG